MKIETALNRVADIGDELVADMTYVAPSELGLDSRSAFRLYVSEEAIAVTHTHDRTLQYYGGFEYVDREFRKEIGDYVFYLAGDSRVRDHISRMFVIEEDMEMGR